MNNDMMISPKLPVVEGKSPKVKGRKKDEEEPTPFADVLNQTLGEGSRSLEQGAGQTGQTGETGQPVAAVLVAGAKADSGDGAWTLQEFSGNGLPSAAEAVFMLRGYTERGIPAAAKAAAASGQQDGIPAGAEAGLQTAPEIQSMTRPIGSPMEETGQQTVGEQMTGMTRPDAKTAGMNQPPAQTDQETQPDGMMRNQQTGTAVSQQKLESRETGEKAGAVKAENGENDGEPKVKHGQEVYPQPDVQEPKSQSGPMITVKVAEPYHMAGRELSEKVSSSISQQLQAGTKHYQIQLKPEQLGRIEVELLKSNGQTVVKLTCESHETAKLLNDHARSMAALLEPHETGEVTVQVRQEDEPLWYQQQGQRQGDGRQNQERQEKKKQKKQEGSDFLEQLRLGLYRI